MMKELNYEPSVCGVAKLYQNLADHIIIDSQDLKYYKTLTNLGFNVHHTDILMRNIKDKTRLAKFVLTKEREKKKN